MKQENKFNEQQQQQLPSELHAEQRTVQEFATTEELLRADANQIVVPPSIAQRLQKSTADLPRPGRSWWKRLFE
jgi:hypothetical protein